MAIYKIHERAFHPDKGFGMGGMWFKGDDRGFSFMTNATARVWSTLRVNTQTPVMDLTQDAPEFLVRSDPSAAPTLLGGRSENYTTKETAPTGTALITGGPEVADGIQSITVQIETRGKNHAFPTEYLADIRNNTGIRQVYDYLGGKNIPMNPETNMLVPDLDVQVAITMVIDRHKKKMRIMSNLTGDGFPNTEVFIYDAADTPLMLNTHHRIGTAAGQLIGNHRHLLGSTVITVDIDGAGNFVGEVKAERCVDFMPWDTDLLAQSRATTFQIYEWNGLHIARTPTEKGIFGMDTDDYLPIPGLGHLWPRDRRDAGITTVFEEPSVADLPHWDH